ncbi:hypothetical protein PHYSODRAFT_566434 [Phytophthora sojae]|uniref:BRCT domain-containing protein n=1 Tax=Phytophthora sojae (strain P6497) TaxID=1094619 RepID=G5AFI7_PHYSP|nr:hypothetical protein PHYSODRAFT_566434 [Phytophthora sojae]EGZ05977.1 hypothetical protein PHYSODRAFT_566434 [Phytophthora sojae]|eukprot:XP_009538838.1 hypothetical protein PHYSODRAFT_566434 [Phytophthora sojae]
MASSPSLFRGLQFYLTRTLSPHDADELRSLIEQHGGVVSASPAGATQLVDYDNLDSRRPEWVSTDYIVDSVASGALQDPARYCGSLFTGRGAVDGRVHAKRKVAYSVEDDARMLHFAKLRGWKSMDTVPQSAWVLAEHEKVTRHSSQSMHEHFRKQLRGKTPKEQRDIMAKAAAVIRARLGRQEAEEEEKDGAAAATPERTTPNARADPTTPATSSPPEGRQRGGSRQQKRKRGTPNGVDAEAGSPRREDDESDAESKKQQPKETGVEFATDPETDEIVSRLQLETHQEMPCVVHALYYCSGDVDMAREFLKGASPSGMWSPDDDLLLVNLVAEESIERSAVEAAVARGNFAAMRVPRNADAILHRVTFLR